MTRELNVRIVMSEPEGSAIPDEFFAEIIKDTIENETLNDVTAIEVHSATPKNANPNEGVYNYSKL